MAKVKMKFDAKKFFIEKGERVGLGAALFAMIAFLGLGAMNAFTSEDTEKVTNDLKQLAQSINTKVQNNPAQQPPPLTSSTKETVVFKEVETKDLLDWFHPLRSGDTKRRNPLVLGPTEFQLDLVRAQLATLIYSDDLSKVGIVRTKKPTKNDVQRLANTKQRVTAGARNQYQELMRRLLELQRQQALAASQNLGTAGQQPGDQGKSENVVEMVDISKEAENARLAENVMPQRMVVITTNFPYKQQLEEFQKALKFATMEEMLRDSTAELAFRGFNVQRRVRGPDGKVKLVNKQEWNDYQWLENYKPILIQSVGPQPDDPALEPILPPEEFRLVLPLPKLARGKYPPVTLKTIEDTVKTIAEESAKSPRIKGRLEQRLEAADPFSQARPTDPKSPQTMPPGQGTTPGQPGSMAAVDLPEFTMVRFVDVDVVPGNTYEYRIQIRIANPNYEKRDLVAVPSLAEKAELLGPWVETPPISVPYESFLYATDLKFRNVVNNALDVPGVQMQRWFDVVRVQNSREPVGEWVSEDIPVERGEYIGRKMGVKLPLWRPADGGFVLRESQAKSRPRVDQQGGVEIDFTTRSILVEFEGGKRSYPVEVIENGKTNTKRISDETGVELLIVTPDGKLLARNSILDAQNYERKSREETFKQWIKEVEEASQKEGSPTKENPFLNKN